MRNNRFHKIAIILCFFAIFYSIIYTNAIAENNNYVYLGGDILGFEINVGGALIVDVGSVETDFGNTHLKTGMQKGDIIRSINGNTVNEGDDIERILDRSDSKVLIGYERNGEQNYETVMPLVESVTGKKRLGLTVKDYIAGLGTVTCVSDNGKFVALGHEIVDYESGARIYNCNGRLRNARINGFTKGIKGESGSVRGQILPQNQGMISDCGRFGIIGSCVINNVGSEKFLIGSRYDVVLGDAQIYSKISGRGEFYDIKIVKTYKQDSPDDKGMVIKVTSDKLVDLTGGIIQGMSGSPIVQKGKIIGAVTHVFVNNPQMGYAIYLDWMW